MLPDPDSMKHKRDNIETNKYIRRFPSRSSKKGDDSQDFSSETDSLNVSDNREVIEDMDYDDASDDEIQDTDDVMAEENETLSDLQVNLETMELSGSEGEVTIAVAGKSRTKTEMNEDAPAGKRE